MEGHTIRRSPQERLHVCRDVWSERVEQGIESERDSNRRLSDNDLMGELIVHIACCKDSC